MSLSTLTRPRTKPIKVTMQINVKDKSCTYIGIPRVKLHHSLVGRKLKSWPVVEKITFYPDKELF